MKKHTLKGKTLPIGVRRDPDLDGYFLTSEIKDLRPYDRIPEPASDRMRTIQIFKAKALGNDIRHPDLDNNRLNEAFR